MRRVVVTGMAAISPIGSDWKTISRNLKTCNTGIEYMQDWECYNEMITRLGAPVNNFKKPKHLSALLSFSSIKKSGKYF